MVVSTTASCFPITQNGDWILQPNNWHLNSYLKLFRISASYVMIFFKMAYKSFYLGLMSKIFLEKSTADEMFVSSQKLTIFKDDLCIFV